MIYGRAPGHTGLGICSAQNLTGPRGAEAPSSSPGASLCTALPRSRAGCLPGAPGRAGRPQGCVRTGAHGHPVRPGGSRSPGARRKHPDVWQAPLLCLQSHFVTLNISSLCTHLPFGSLSTLIRQTPGCWRPEAADPRSCYRSGLGLGTR